MAQLVIHDRVARKKVYCGIEALSDGLNHVCPSKEA